MKSIEELRVEFECLVGAHMVRKSIMVYSEKYNKYLMTDDCFKAEVAYVNGMWFMFQEIKK